MTVDIGVVAAPAGSTRSSRCGSRCTATTAPSCRRPRCSATTMLGIADLSIGVMVGNEDALRFYRRRGLVPVELFLRRVAG